MALATAAISAAPATCERPRPRRPFNHGSRLLAPHQRPKMVVCSRRGAAIFARAGRHWSEANARGVASRRGILSLLVTPVAASLLPARADVIDEQGSSSLVAQADRELPAGKLLNDMRTSAGKAWKPFDFNGSATAEEELVPFVEAFDPSTDYGKAAGGAAGAVALAGALYSAATTSQAKVELEAKADQLSTELEASADKLKGTAEKLAQKTDRCVSLEAELADARAAKAKVDKEFAAAQQQHKVQIQEEQRLRNKTKASEIAVQQTLDKTLAELESSQRELKSTSAKLVETSSELQAKRSTLTEKEARLGATTKELESNKSRLAETLGKLSATQDELAETRKALSNTEKTLKATAANLEDLRGSLAGTQKECAKLESELQSSRADLKDAAGELSSANELVQALTEELAEARKMADRQLAEKEVEITSLKDKGVDDAHNIKGLEGELEEACTLIDCLEGDLQKAKSFASVLQEKIGLLRAEVNARQETVDDLTRQGEEMQASIQDLRQQLVDRTEKWRDSEKWATELSESLNKTQEQLKQERSRSGELEHALGNLQATLEVKEAALQHEVETVRQLRTHVKSTSSDYHRSMNEMAETKERLNRRVIELQEQVSKLQKDAMARERMLQAALTKAQNDASAMSQELKKQQAGTSQPVNPPQDGVAGKGQEAELQREVEDLRAKLSDLQGQLEAAIEDAKAAKGKLMAERDTVATLERARAAAVKDIRKALAEARDASFWAQDLEERVKERQERVAALEKELAAARSSARDAQEQLVLQGGGEDGKLLVELAGAKEDLHKLRKASRAEIAVLAAELSELKQKMAAIKQAGAA